MMQNDHNRMRLRVSGHVQGVGFRWYIVAEARRLKVSGWVRNNPDGSVELEAEGPAAALQTLRQRAAKGPPSAHVEQVAELPSGTDQLPLRFETKR